MTAQNPETGGTVSDDLSHRYEAISNRFVYHPPTDAQVITYQTLRRHAKELGYLIEELCPESEEKKTALIRLDETVMHANAAIARHTPRTL